MKNTISSRRIIKSLKSEAAGRRRWAERVADWISDVFGSVAFLALNMLWFVFWIVANLGFIPAVPPFDPYPFGLLTMIVSLEAIFLSVFVLISQNRAAKVDDLREEIDLQVDIITEEELTKLMNLVVKIAEKNGISVSQDAELREMLKPTDMKKIKSALERQVENS